MEPIAYVNGAFVPLSEAKVSVLDRGFLFADGIYEVAAVLDGKLIDNASHLARLERSVGEISLALPESLERIEEIQKELVKRNNLVNGMVYLRGAASDYDAWAGAGCRGWGWADVVPSFVAMERWLRPAVLEPHNPVSVAMRDAAVQTGIPLNPDFDRGTLDGAGWNRSAILRGERHNANRAFLGPITDRQNLTVMPESRVRRVLLDGTRATGVEVIQDGKLQTIAAGEVILSAGAFESPRVLMLSGIGPADHLSAHGIAPVLDLPVGNNLIDHLLIGVVYTSRQPISTQNAYATEGCAFVRSTPDRADCDIEISFAKEPHFAPEVHDGLPRYTIIPGITKPKSRGTVRLTGSDLDAPLAIDPNYFADPADMACMIRAVRMSREIGAQAALEDWNAGEFFPGVDVESDEAIDAYVRKDVSTWFHPVGACRMGIGEDAVVDPLLRVRGTERLRVADASIMPDIVGVNTNAASTMIGWHAAELFLRG